MDESSMIERLRLDADQIDADDTDVDALVGGALVQGRRRRVRRRAGAALGAVVAAAVVVTVVATGVVPTGLGSVQPGPVATPVIATPVPSAVATESSPSVTPSASAATSGQLSGTPAQVQATLVGLLPASITVTRAVSDSSRPVEGTEHNAYLDLRDAKGTSNLMAGVGNGRYTDMCASNDPCIRSALPGGGTLWLTGGPDPDKAGEDQSAFYNRPDGGRVWLTQTNFVNGNGPVTRQGLPLTTAEVRTLVTSPALNRFFQG